MCQNFVVPQSYQAHLAMHHNVVPAGPDPYLSAPRGREPPSRDGRDMPRDMPRDMARDVRDVRDRDRDSRPSGGMGERPGRTGFSGEQWLLRCHTLMI